MEEWGAELYGDPCRGCGFGWGLTPDAAVSLVGSIPGKFTDRLAGASGREQHPDLAWARAAYVSHVADNLRIWSSVLLVPGSPASLGEWCCSTLLAEHSGPRTSRATTRTTPSITCGMSTARRLQAT
jgi:hypothetical protein